MSSRLTEYDYEASSYDESRFYSKLGRHLDYMHKKIVGSLLPSSAELMLEMGVGTGRFTTWLAEKSFDIIGIDISREMLKTSKNKMRVKHTEVSLVLADMHFLPFRRELFDSCICINVMDHIPDVSNILKEVKGIIKPKGFFIFNISNLQSPYLAIALLVNLRKKALFKGNIYSRWLTLKEINALSVRNNFNIKEVRGCMIATPIPLGERLVMIVRSINLLMESSRLRFFSGSVFIKAQRNPGE